MKTLAILFTVALLTGCASPGWGPHSQRMCQTYGMDSVPCINAQHQTYAAQAAYNRQMLRTGAQLYRYGQPRLYGTNVNVFRY